MTRHRPALLFALSLLAVALVGCSPPAAPTPTPTPAFASEAEAFAAAEKTYREYIDAFNQVNLGQPTTFEAVFEHSAGEYQRTERKSLSAMHAKGYSRGGEIRVVWLKRQSMSKGGKVVIRTCDDLSRTTFTDSVGQSLVPPERPNTVALDLSFENRRFRLVLVAADPVVDESCVA